ncbi:MAG: response regulator [Anaerolineae bacterium]|nr:response regulator [Anaerolineae bacterium]
MQSQPVRTLLIEDNPGDARLIQEMLREGEHPGFDLTLVNTLKGALEQLSSTRYDLILLDLSLPDSFGMDTLLKTQAEAPDTTLIVLTGFDDHNLGIQAVQMGAQDYLTKNDVDSKLLNRSIRYAMERQRIEFALVESQKEYRSLIDDVFETSMVAVLILDKSFTVVWCNEATEVYFGIEREELLGQDKRDLIDEKLKCIFADPDDYATRLKDAYDNEKFTDRFECHVNPGPNREDRWLEHWSQPIRSGMFIGGRIEQYTDITERKQLEFAEQEQREFAEALREIATLLTSTLELDEVLNRILNNLDRVVPHDAASITLLGEDGSLEIVRQNVDGKRDTKELNVGDPVQIESLAFLRQALTAPAPVIVADLQNPEYDSQLVETTRRRKIRSYAAAPIRLQQVAAGSINVFSKKANFFDEKMIQRLNTFAELAAIAIQNAHLYQKSQELATLEERQRLARELHDSVSQTLFTSSAMAETALRRWNKDRDRAHELLEEVHHLTTTALAEMRVLLLELRPAALTQVTLKQLFEQYLQPIQHRRQFELSLDIENIPQLEPDVQIGLYRIAQEALNNIDKHAQAAQVQIQARKCDGHLELIITDNGEGFNRAEVSSTSLGLEIMQERARSIGASLEITSEIGRGTTVAITWPGTERVDE